MTTTPKQEPNDEPDIAGLRVVLTLPTRDDFAKATATLLAAVNELESVDDRLDKIGDHSIEHAEFPAGVDVDEAYIGALYDFIDTIKVYGDEINEHAENLDEILGQLNSQVHQDLAARKAGA